MIATSTTPTAPPPPRNYNLEMTETEALALVELLGNILHPHANDIVTVTASQAYGELSRELVAGGAIERTYYANKALQKQFPDYTRRVYHQGN